MGSSIYRYVYTLWSELTRAQRRRALCKHAQPRRSLRSADPRVRDVRHAAVEDSACGKPVVASDHGGLREVVPLDCGSRFVNGDERDLVEKIGCLIDDRQAYLRASVRARENAESFGWSKVVDRLDEIYSIFLKPEH